MSDSMTTSTVSPDVFEAPLERPQIIRNGWASKEDWIKHQTLIGQLYRQQSLTEVMAFMEKEHHFRATEKMYKTRIKQWSLDKKHKENEMRAIVRKTKTLDSQGKSATFRVRGRPVDYKDVVSYFKRKNVRPEDVIAQRTGSKTPEAVDCCILIPSPITAPDFVAIPERILISIRDYFCSSFESGTWVTTTPQRFCTTTKVQRHPSAGSSFLLGHCRRAIELFHSNRFQEAGHHLITATSRIRSTILAERPSTLLHVFSLLEACHQAKRYEIALAVLRQFSALAEIILGKMHPIRCICGWLASIAASQAENVIKRCMVSVGDHFESLAGPLNMSTLWCRLAFINSQFDTGYDMNQRLIIQKNLLHKCETILGPQDFRTGKVRLSLALCNIKILDYAEAVKVGWDVIIHAQNSLLSSWKAELYTEALHIIATAEHAVGDNYSAEIHLRESIESCISRYGPNDSQAILGLIKLERWLVKQGQLSSAAQVQKRWKKMLPDCTDDV